jgi:hypothetical protein
MAQSKYGYVNGEFVNVLTGAIPTQAEKDASDVAHSAIIAADERFQVALVKRYKSRAADMRYRTDALPADLKALALAYQDAVSAWRKTWEIA